mmetsp:Transcript_9926/g.31091  ORF Transcript_9926/g.31091 Transcript_9926/m.31091 type:complete len:154 (+) Transcript_9926:93-554(+)
MFCQEQAKQLKRDLLPRLQEARGGAARLLFCSIGTRERALEFAAHTGFPAEMLYADPENAAYEALGLYKGVGRTFFRAETPFAIFERLQADGAKDMAEVLPKWKPWLPPDQSQGLQQGGTLVFKGAEELLLWKDPATGAHASLDEVAQKAVGA